ncbi:MAG: transposase [Pseudomonadota bacterium]|nr:transposase [Pseudomonadota bacterium]
MARPLRIEYPGAYYHVTSRGNERKDIFWSSQDRRKFLSYLESAVVRYGATIHAWTLMSNHYHLLIETPSGNLSQIMRHINGAYTTYFNVKQQRSGHLFQGRYKAILIDADNYATELSRYIHLNPVRAGIVDKPEDYPWSSYKSYIGREKTPEWQKTEFILGYFNGHSSGEAKIKYMNFVEDLLGKEYVSPMKATIASTILGNENFTRRISRMYLGVNRTDRNVPAVKILTTRLSLDEIIDIIKKELGENEDLIKKMTLFFCRKYSGAKLKEIGERFDMSEAAVSQACRRLELLAKQDQHLEKLLSRLDDTLNRV